MGVPMTQQTLDELKAALNAAEETLHTAITTLLGRNGNKHSVTNKHWDAYCAARDAKDAAYNAHNNAQWARLRDGSDPDSMPLTASELGERSIASLIQQQLGEQQ